MPTLQNSRTPFQSTECKILWCTNCSNSDRVHFNRCFIHGRVSLPWNGISISPSPSPPPPCLCLSHTHVYTHTYKLCVYIHLCIYMYTNSIAWRFMKNHRRAENKLSMVQLVPHFWIDLTQELRKTNPYYV